MKPCWIIYSAIALLACSASDGLAYEQVTHAAMMREALMLSKLNPAAPDLLNRLGLSGRQPSLGKIYLDLSDTGGPVNRSNAPTGRQYPPDFGRTKINEANKLAAFQPPLDSLPGWLMLGAIREDDVKYDSGAAENNPQDDPNGQTNRVLNHFYDPYHDSPLTFADPSVAAVTKIAPFWALDAGNGNDFTVLRAREAMWRALTLKSYSTQGLADLSFTASADVPTKEALRVAYWATAFRALGDVVHILQDMAQPQHTRNDPHSGLYCASWTCPGGHASFYEKYVDANVKGDAGFTLRERSFWNSMFGGAARDTSVPIIARQVAYTGYPPPRFADYRSYFVTATGPASVGGKGLANYSNQGFYSAGTNAGSGALANGYSSPPPTGQGLSDAVIGAGSVKDANDQPVNGVLILKTGNVLDAANSPFSAAAVRLSSYGMFDQFTKPAGKAQYTLNHYNYDDQMRLLIPRAVAYSAGLLDFFFRGRMDIALPDEGIYSIVDHAEFASQNSVTDPLGGFKGFRQIRLRLSNSTPPVVTTGDGVTVPQGMTSGTLVSVVKFHRNACYRDTLDGEITDPQQFPWCRTDEEEIVVSDPIKIPEQGTIPMSTANASSAEFIFKFGGNALPINAWDVVLQVVYRGQLGSESDAVVVETKNISEPTFIATFNDTDRIMVGGTCYDPDTVAATDALWNQLHPSCKPTSGTTRKVADVCVNVPLNVRLTGGDASAAVTVATDYLTAQSAPIGPRRFARFAFLGDAAATTTIKLDLNNALALQNTVAPRYMSYQAQREDQVTFSANAYQVSRSTVADAYARHRGIKTWAGQAFIVDGTTGMVAGTCPESQFDPLQGPERYPQRAVIMGWDNL